MRRLTIDERWPKVSQLMGGRAVVLGAVLTLVAAVSAVAAFSANGFGPGMMSGLDGGMMGGPFGGGAGPSGTAKPTTEQLKHVASEIDAWLASRGFSGFKAAEVMAFTNNDYVAVHDARGMPAFELLTNLLTSWVIEEPPSMMWNTKYGMVGRLGTRMSPMMGGWMTDSRWSSWYAAGRGKVTTTGRAVAVANRWLAAVSPHERVASDAGGSAMGKFPGYYSFDTASNGQTVGMLSVNARTGAVWYHAWHGRFLAEHEL
jgi:hypothetical protein